MSPVTGEICQETHDETESTRHSQEGDIVPKIVQARDLSPACRATDPGDVPQRVECSLNGAAGERTSSRLRPFGTVSSAMNRGAMIPAASPARHQPRASANRKNGLRR
jgi:hypothetical protein